MPNAAGVLTMANKHFQNIATDSMILPTVTAKVLLMVRCFFKVLLPIASHWHDCLQRTAAGCIRLVHCQPNAADSFMMAQSHSKASLSIV